MLLFLKIIKSQKKIIFQGRFYSNVKLHPQKIALKGYAACPLALIAMMSFLFIILEIAKLFCDLGLVLDRPEKRPKGQSIVITTITKKRKNIHIFNGKKI